MTDANNKTQEERDISPAATKARRRAYTEAMRKLKADGERAMAPKWSRAFPASTWISSASSGETIWVKTVRLGATRFQSRPASPITSSPAGDRRSGGGRGGARAAKSGRT